MYYGIYITTNESSGQSKKIASEGRDEVAFPPGIQYDGLRYRFLTSYAVSTPSQEKQFREYCEENHIETDITI